MSPLRLLILAGLLYLVYRLLTGGTEKPAKSDKPADSGRQEATHDVLVQDPSCGVLIPKGQAVTMTRDGQPFYFCSTRCRDSFLGENHKGENI